MPCSLREHTVEVPAWYVASDGRRFPYDEYLNHGAGGTKIWNGKPYMDLPTDGYPYKVEYSTVPRFVCCRNCECSDI